MANFERVLDWPLNMQLEATELRGNSQEEAAWQA